MKRCIVLLSVLLLSGYAQAEEIHLDATEPIEKNINLETPDKNVMESSPQKLKNCGFVWQNSIAPVNGLKYNSQILIEKPKPQEANDSKDSKDSTPQQPMYYEGQQQTDSTMP